MRQGLVKKQVQVTKNGKTFTQTVWVRPDGAPDLDSKSSGLKELEEIFKTDKQGGLDKLKELGITWEENAHPAINLMRAKMAMKSHFSSSPKTSDVKPNAQPDKTPDSKPDSVDSDILTEFNEMYKKDKSGALSMLKAKGLTWKESDHVAINVMRAKMAMKNFKVDTTPKEQIKPTEPIKEVPKVEEPKKEKIDVKKLMSTRSKTREEFNNKIKLLSEELTNSQAVSVNNIGMMGTDEKAIDYITKFLEPRYTRFAETLRDEARILTETDVEFWVNDMFGKVLPSGVRQVVAKLSKITTEKAFNTHANPTFAVKAFSVPSKLTSMDKPVFNRFQSTLGKEKREDSNDKNARAIYDPKEFRDYWDNKVDSLVRGLESSKSYKKEDVNRMKLKLEKFLDFLTRIDNNPLVVDAISTTYSTKKFDYQEVAQGIRFQKAVNRLDLEEDMPSTAKDAYERGEFVVLSPSNGMRRLFSKQIVDSTRATQTFLNDPKNEALVKSGRDAIHEILQEPILASALRLGTEWEKAVSDADWAVKEDFDLGRLSPVILKGRDFDITPDTATESEKLTAQLNMLASNFEIGASAAKLKPSLQKNLADHMAEAESKIDNVREFLANLPDDLNKVESVTDVERPTSINCNSIISSVTGSEYDDVVAQISKDFDNKHSVKSYKVLGVYKVDEMPNMDADFEKAKKSRGNVRTLYHGTGSFATGAIVGKSGEFKIVKAKVGRMLGDGIYLADKTSKSMLYVSDEGYSRQGVQGTMMVCEAVLGKTSPDKYHDTADTVEALCDKPGIWNGLQNSEWCVRDAKAVRPRYLVHVKC